MSRVGIISSELTGTKYQQQQQQWPLNIRTRCINWWRLQLGHNRLARVISYYWYRLITRRWWAACAGMTRLPHPSLSLPPQIMILFSSHNSCHSGGGRHAAAASLHPSHHHPVNLACLQHNGGRALDNIGGSQFCGNFHNIQRRHTLHWCILLVECTY